MKMPVGVGSLWPWSAGECHLIASLILCGPTCENLIRAQEASRGKSNTALHTHIVRGQPDQQANAALMVELGRRSSAERRGVAHVQGGQGDDGAKEHGLLEGPAGDLAGKGAPLVAEVIPRREGPDVVLEVLGEPRVLEGGARCLGVGERPARGVCGVSGGSGTHEYINHDKGSLGTCS